MSMFHLDTRVGQRSKGQSVAAKLAYNGGCRLDDRRLGKNFDYSRKTAVTHSEILSPANAPEWVHDRQELAARIEESERNRDGGWREKAVLWREIEISFPRGLTLCQRQDIVRERCAEYVAMGMVAVVDHHSPAASDGEPNDHAHITLTQRPLDSGTTSGFAKKKDRRWDALFNDGTKEALKAERGRWADAVNAALERAGLEDRVDHRSYADRGIARIPTTKIGVAGTAIERRGGTSVRAEANRRLKAINRKISTALGEAEAELQELEQKETKAMTYKEKRDLHRGRIKEAFAGRLELPEKALDGVRYVDARSPRRVRIRLQDGEWIGVERARVTVSPRTEAANRILPDILKAAKLTEGHVVEVTDRQAGVSGRKGQISKDNHLTKEDLADRWRSHGYHDVAAQPDGIHIWLPGGTRLHDQGHQVTIHGPVSDDAIAALVEKAKRDWGGGMELTGTWSQADRERVWMECQRQGVALSGFEPSLELQARFDRERGVAARNAIRQAELKVRASAAADKAAAVAAYAAGTTEGHDIDPAIRRYIDSMSPANRGNLAASDAPDIMLRMKEMHEAGQDMPEQERQTESKPKTKGPAFGPGARGDD